MHMKRAMQCFELRGLHPVPYPVDFLSGGEYRWTDFLPSVDNLWKMNIIFREYLALGWYWIKGRMSDVTPVEHPGRGPGSTGQGGQRSGEVRGTGVIRSWLSGL